MTCYKGELTVFYLGILNETWDPDYDCDDLTEAPCIGDQEVLHVYGEEMELAAEAKRPGQYLDEDAESVCTTTFLDGGILVEDCGAPLIPARAFAVGVLELSIFASSFEPQDLAANTKEQPGSHFHIYSTACFTCKNSRRSTQRIYHETEIWGFRNCPRRDRRPFLVFELARKPVRLPERQ